MHMQRFFKKMYRPFFIIAYTIFDYCTDHIFFQGVRTALETPTVCQSLRICGSLPIHVSPGFHVVQGIHYHILSLEKRVRVHSVLCLGAH